VGGSAGGHHARPCRIALAWLFAKSDDIVPIPGPNAGYLEGDLAAERVQLDLAQYKMLDDALAPENFSKGFTRIGSWRRMIDDEPRPQSCHLKTLNYGLVEHES